MGTESRTRITVETERILIIATGDTVRGWCEKCGCEVEMSSTETAGGATGRLPVTLELRRRRAKDGLVGCMKSLLHLLKTVRGQPKSH